MVLQLTVRSLFFTVPDRIKNLMTHAELFCRGLIIPNSWLHHTFVVRHVLSPTTHLQLQLSPEGFAETLRLLPSSSYHGRSLEQVQPPHLMNAYRRDVIMMPIGSTFAQ